MGTSKRKIVKEFKVAAKSSNTNSFGLHQLILIAQDGEAYKTHASMYNAKDIGEIMRQEITIDEHDEITGKYFIGTEMTDKLPDAPKEVLEEIWK